MKKISIVLFVFMVVLTAHSQSDFLEQKPISISYFGHYGFHPGIKIGTQYDWKKWDKEIERKKRSFTKNKSLFISPQIGFYTHPKNHSSLLLNADIGYQRIKNGKGFYSAYSIGLGYMTQFNVGTTYIKQDDGTLRAKKIASRSYFMPTLNAEFGQKINQNWGWYSKFSVGSKLFYNTGVSAESFIELGIKFNLGNKVI